MRTHAGPGPRLPDLSACDGACIGACARLPTPWAPSLPSPAAAAAGLAVALIVATHPLPWHAGARATTQDGSQGAHSGFCVYDARSGETVACPDSSMASGDTCSCPRPRPLSLKESVGRLVAKR